MMVLDSSLMNTCNKTQAKKIYTGVVLAKNPLMIKSEKNFQEVSYQRIQLESGFWRENCVYLYALTSLNFIATAVLMSHRSLYLFAMASALQVDI